MSQNERISHTHGSIVGWAVCPKCRIINKIRTKDESGEETAKCKSCGTELSINKVGPTYSY